MTIFEFSEAIFWSTALKIMILIFAEISIDDEKRDTKFISATRPIGMLLPPDTKILAKSIRGGRNWNNQRVENSK